MFLQFWTISPLDEVVVIVTGVLDRCDPSYEGEHVVLHRWKRLEIRRHHNLIPESQVTPFPDVHVRIVQEATGNSLRFVSQGALCLTVDRFVTHFVNQILNLLMSVLEKANAIPVFG